MQTTGIVRRIDDLGRVVVPKEIRRRLNLREGDPMELFTDGNRLILEKYFPMGQYVGQAIEYVRAFQSVAQRYIFVTDTDKVIASVLRDFSDAPLSAELADAIRRKTDAENIPFQPGEDCAEAEYAAIIRDGSRDSIGEGIGAVVLVSNGSPTDDALKTQIKIATDFLGRLANKGGW